MSPAAARTASFLLLRAFFAQFWILQFLGKIRDQESGITALRNLGIWSAHTTAWFSKQTPLPEALVRPYTLLLPWVELSLGLLLLLGLRVRAALVAAGALLVSLDVGLMLQQKHDLVAANTIHLLALIVALHLAGHDRFGLDGLGEGRR